jgi:predicted alpha/beta-hydrolase family hydrolase
VNLLFDGPERARRTIVLAHGAGAPMDSPFLNAFAAGLAATGLRVARFEFPYMAARRAPVESGGRGRGPDRPQVLEATWRAAIDALGARGLVIGGKSLGGRVASMVADGAGVGGLVCLGYPFHPPGKPENLRTAHLETLHTPALVCQGTRDPFGKRDEVATYRLSPSIEVRWIEDGDHDFAPRKSSGRTKDQNWRAAIDHVVAFVASLPSA